MLKHLAAAMAAGLAIASFATSASATEGQDTRASRVTVKYGDLDLGQRRDAHTLLVRLERAATEACGGAQGFYPAWALSGRSTHEFRECRANAMSKAVATIGSPNLQEAFKARI